MSQLTKAAMALSASAAMLLSLGEVAADSPAETAKLRITADLPDTLGVLDIDIPEKLRSKDLTGSRLSVKWQRAAKVGTRSVKLITTSKSGEQSEYWARVKIGERVRVLVASRELKQGDRVSEGDLLFKTETVARKSGWRLAPNALQGATILRDVSVGGLVSDDDIEAPPPIARGEAIAVEIHKGRLRVTTRGVVERAARPGELTTIRLTATKKLVRARLVSASAAVLEETQ